MNTDKIRFNIPNVVGRELEYVGDVLSGRHLAGDGSYTKAANRWIEEHTGCSKALLTHSCTAALEMAALLLDITPGDEIIMPSYTFVSTANAFVLRGGVPVFVDVREDTLNLDERQIEQAITPRTRAIVPVHYAGVSCEMDAILEIAGRHGLAIVEDAAQGVMSRYKGQPLGAIGDYGAFSFHETKNVISGEGGALLVRDIAKVPRAEIIREKGTDRSRFLRGEVDKYTWHEPGSSYLPSEIIAACLWAQIERAQDLTEERLRLWDRYHDRLEPLETAGRLRRPIVPAHCEHNAHMYYVLLPQGIERQRVAESLREEGVQAVSHYVPLHSAPAGLRYGRAAGGMKVTDSIAARLLRLPLWYGLDDWMIARVVAKLAAAL